MSWAAVDTYLPTVVFDRHNEKSASTGQAADVF